MRRRLVLPVAFALLAGASFAQEKPLDEKSLAKACDDIEKELTARKADPGPALELLAHFAQNGGLPVKDAVALTHEILARKIPPMDALACSLEKQHDDPKKW